MCAKAPSNVIAAVSSNVTIGGVGTSSSLRHVAAAAALSALVPSCLLFDLGGLTGAPSGDGGASDAGGIGDVGTTGDAQSPKDAPGPEANDGNGEAPEVMPEGGVDAGDAGEAGLLSYAATVLSDGPIAYWRLDDTTTATAKDSSGYGHDGSYQGGVTLGATGIPGDVDKAVYFDGSGEMTVTLPGLFDFAGNAPYSVELWAKPASGPTSMGFVGKSTYDADAGGYSGWYVACASDDSIDSWRNNGDTGNPAPTPRRDRDLRQGPVPGASRDALRPRNGAVTRQEPKRATSAFARSTNASRWNRSKSVHVQRVRVSTTRSTNSLPSR